MKSVEGNHCGRCCEIAAVNRGTPLALTANGGTTQSDYRVRVAAAVLGTRTDIGAAAPQASTTRRNKCSVELVWPVAFNCLPFI